MQFLTISPNLPNGSQGATPFRKIITYHQANNSNEIKLGSSMLLYNHYISINNLQQFERLLQYLNITKCQKHTRDDGIDVDYHLETDTYPLSKATMDALIKLGFPKSIYKYNKVSIGVNVEQKLFPPKDHPPNQNWDSSGVIHRHIQISYSDQSKTFTCIDKNDNHNISHNAFIFNIHIACGNAGSYINQLKDIPTKSKTKMHPTLDPILQKLWTLRTHDFSKVEEFNNYCFHEQNCKILELDKEIITKKLRDKNMRVDEIEIQENINNILNTPISQETLEIDPRDIALPIVAIDNNPGIPPAADIDDNTEVPATILDNQANNSSDGSDLTSLTSKISNVLHIDDNLQNPDLSSSGEGAKDTPDTR